MQRTSIGSDSGLHENRRSISSVDNNNNVGRSSVSSDTKGRVSISSNDSSSAKNSRPSKNFGTSKNDDSGMVLKIC